MAYLAKFMELGYFLKYEQTLSEQEPYYLLCVLRLYVKQIHPYCFTGGMARLSPRYFSVYCLVSLGSICVIARQTVVGAKGSEK